MTTFQKHFGKIKLKPKERYSEDVREILGEWVKEYARKLFENINDGLEENDKLTQEALDYVRLAVTELALRVYHFTVLSETVDIETGRKVLRHAKKSPLMRSLQERHGAEYERFKKTGESKPEWKPKDRQKQFLFNRFKRALEVLETGNGMAGIEGLSDIATMQDAIRDEWRERNNESNNLFKNVSEYGKPPYNFFQTLLEHHHVRGGKSANALKELQEGTVLKLPTHIIPDTDPPEGDIKMEDKKLTIAMLNTQELIEEEGALQAHCVGSYDIFTRIAKGTRRGKPKTMIFSLYEELSQAEPMKNVAHDTGSAYYKKEYDNLLTKRKPLVTIEYDVNTGAVRQVKLSANARVNSQEDPLYEPLFQALRRLHAYCQANNMPIRSFSGDLQVIQKTKPFLTIKGEEKDIDELDDNDIIVSGSEITLSENTTLEQLNKYAKLSNVRLDATELLRKDPSVFTKLKPPFVRGSVIVKDDIDGIDFSGVLIGGDLDLESLSIAEGLTLPREIGGDLDLRSLITAEGLTMPREIGGDLYLSSLTTAEGLVLPEKVGRDLDLESLTTAEGLTMPEKVGGDLELSSLTTAEGLVLPDSFTGMVFLSEDIPEDEFVALRKKYPNINFELQ